MLGVGIESAAGIRVSELGLGGVRVALHVLVLNVGVGVEAVRFAEAGNEAGDLKVVAEASVGLHVVCSVNFAWAVAEIGSPIG
jgi:hypothetical protein